MNCGTCKHWGALKIEHDRPSFKDCGRVLFIKDYLPKDAPYSTPFEYEPDEPAYVNDHEDYGAELFTRESFGCVLWEGK